MIKAKDGSKIYYNVYGEGKTIVLLHGNFQHHRFFAKQINFFSQYYRVIAMVLVIVIFYSLSRGVSIFQLFIL